MPENYIHCLHDPQRLLFMKMYIDRLNGLTVLMYAHYNSMCGARPSTSPHQGSGNETSMVVVDQYASNSQWWPGNGTTVVIYI